MPKPKVNQSLASVKEFWNRFARSMETWFPELANPREWAAKLQASEHDVYNWKKRRPGKPPTRPKRGIPQLVEMYGAAGLADRGGDPQALARHVYTGEGEMPMPPMQPTPQVDSGAASGGQKTIIKLVEAAVEDEVTDANARLVAETVQRIIRNARKAGLIALHGVSVVLVLLAGQAEAAEALVGDVGELSSRLPKPENVLIFGLVLRLRGRSPRIRIFRVLLADSTCKPVLLAKAV